MKSYAVNFHAVNFHVLTLFPEMIEQATNHSILKRGMAAGHITVNAVNIRDFAANKHKQVDDTPYGGGSGMVMMAPPIYDAVKSIDRPGARFLYLSPHGRVFNQTMAAELSLEEDIVLLCGHYEGIDQRVIDLLEPEEVSVGDYILTGGELAALVMIDAISRLVPGVVGKDESVKNESFSDYLEGGLEYPHYTRPPEFMGLAVPEVLLSGHHGRIEAWRREQSLVYTKNKRPDLL